MANLKSKYYFLGILLFFIYFSVVETASFASTNFNGNTNSAYSNINTNSNTNTNTSNQTSRVYSLTVNDSDFLKKFTRLNGYQGVNNTLELPNEFVTIMPSTNKSVITNTDDTLITQYTSDKVIIKSTYKALDGNSDKIKQAYELTNRLGKTLTAHFFIDYQINIDSIEWDKKNYVLSSTEKILTPYAVSLPENLKSYLSLNYYNGAKITFGNFGMNFHDIITSGKKYQTSVFTSNKKNIIRIKVSLTIPAQGKIIVDPILEAKPQEEGDETPQLSFRRSDSNGDGDVDISDGINTLGWLFTDTGNIGCKDAADANDDGTIDISDAISTFGWLFLGTDEPPFPGAFIPGLDPTQDSLNCENGINIPIGTADIGPAGGAVQSSDAQTLIEIPAGALADQATITVNPTAEFPQDEIIGQAYDFGPDGIEFNNPIKLTIRYDETGLSSDVDEDGIIIATVEDGYWKELETVRNTRANFLTVQTNHFSKYAVLMPGEIWYQAIDLHPTHIGIKNSGAVAVDGNTQVGWVDEDFTRVSASLIFEPLLGRPPLIHTSSFLWKGSAESASEITPILPINGLTYVVMDVDKEFQVGGNYVMQGTRASAIYFPSENNLTGISKNKMSGYKYLLSPDPLGWHAMYYSTLSTSTPPIDLHPSGNYTTSWAAKISEFYQVGGATLPFDETTQIVHAMRWSGTNQSALDLNPPGSAGSYAYDVYERQIVGFSESGGNIRATLWNGETGNFVILDQAMFESTFAFGVSKNFQVGMGYKENSFHALQWSGGGSKILDLHNFLPQTFNRSYAMGVDETGNIVGGGSFYDPTGLTPSWEHAILWKALKLSDIITLDIDVDTDRDNVVENSDDETDEEKWSPGLGGKGAIILANSDDDGGDNVPDNWPGGDLKGDSTLEPANMNIDFGNDIDDIGPLWVHKLGINTLPNDLEITIQISQLTTENSYFNQYSVDKRARIFLPSQVDGNDLIIQRGDEEILGPSSGTMVKFVNDPNPEVSGERSYDIFKGNGIIKFGIEGIAYGAPLQITLSAIRSGRIIKSDIVQLGVAPYIAFSHQDRIDRSFPGYTIYTKDFRPDDTDLRKKLEAEYFLKLKQEFNFWDRWHQDPYEIGYSQAPYQKMWVILGLPRGQRIDTQHIGTGTFNQYAREEVMEDGVGLITDFYITPDRNNDGVGDFNNQEYGGNFEVQRMGNFGPFGRIVFGEGAGSNGGKVSPLIVNFLRNMGVQKVVDNIDLKWMDLGHIDEVVSFPSGLSSGIRNRARVASPETAWALLIISQQRHNGGNIQMVQNMNQTGSFGVTVNNLLMNTDGDDLDSIYTDNFDKSSGYSEKLIGVRTQLGLTSPVSNPESAESATAKLRRAGYLEANDGLFTRGDEIEWKISFITDDDYIFEYRKIGETNWFNDGFGKKSQDSVSTSMVTYILSEWWDNSVNPVSGDEITYRTKPSPDMVELPVLFFKSPSNNKARAFTGNVINTIIDGSTIFVTNAYGPNVLPTVPSDIIHDYVLRMLRLDHFTNIITVDDFFYHNECGSIHCATNALREIPSIPWWERN